MPLFEGGRIPRPLGRLNFYANDGGVETSPVQNEKSPQDFFFSNEDTPPNLWFELCGGVLHFGHAQIPAFGK
jgi:hypothetical protein